MFSEPVNFKDANGAWQPIDSRLMPSSASGFAYENAANSFSVRFANSPAGTFSQFQTTAGRVSLSLLGVDPTALAAAKPPVVAAADGELVYPSVEPGVNLAYRVTATGVKESIVLARSDVPASYSFLLHPASGQQLSAKREPNWTSPVSVDTG